jgi:hypothetical protein
MNHTPKGKIGRLPKSIREQVNWRMENGEKGRVLAEWLNSLPEVQAVMAAEFGGWPIREQNLSDWRKYGHQDWRRWREAQAMMAMPPGGVPAAGTEPLTDRMAEWAAVYYLMTVRELNQLNGEGAAGSRSKLKMLRAFCRDVVALQRGECRSGQLKLEREQLTLRSRRMAKRTGTAPGAPLQEHELESALTPPCQATLKPHKCHAPT